jgi:hypothetical protein
VSALPIQSTIDQLHSAGLNLSLTPEMGLRVVPASGITPELRELIRTSEAALVDYLQQPVVINTDAANDTTEPFTEPLGYEGTGWRLAGADGLSPATLAKFRAASLALDANQSANNLQLQGAST